MWPSPLDLGLAVAFGILAYLVCLGVDAIFKYRIENAYIGRRGGISTTPSFWNGFTARHAVLLPVAILIQHIVRFPGRVGSVLIGATCVLVVIYWLVLLRDIFRRARAGSVRSASSSNS